MNRLFINGYYTRSLHRIQRGALNWPYADHLCNDETPSRQDWAARPRQLGLSPKPLRARIRPIRARIRPFRGRHRAIRAEEHDGRQHRI